MSHGSALDHGGVTYRICFVCSGNICRSPMAEVVARAVLERHGLDGVVVDSAGVGDWHVGEGADPRTVRVLQEQGYDGSRHRVRQFDPAWFDRLDLVVALDRGHERALRAMAPDEAARERVVLLRAFDDVAVAAGTLEVDDPWYGDQDGFVRCLADVARACEGLVETLRRDLAQGRADVRDR